MFRAYSDRSAAIPTTIATLHVYQRGITGLEVVLDRLKDQLNGQVASLSCWPQPSAMDFGVIGDFGIWQVAK